VAALSGAAPPERIKRATAPVERERNRRDDGLALLFAPPFDRAARDPGYVKSCPPGVREDGELYTRAATWSAMAFAPLGVGDMAFGPFSLLNSINRARSRADARRLDVVRSISGLAAARRRREQTRAAYPRRLPASRPLHSQGVDDVRDERAATIGALRDRRRQSGRGQPGRPVRRDRWR